MNQKVKIEISDNQIKILQSNHWTQKIYQKIDKEHLAFLLVFISQFFYPLGFIYSNQNNINSFQTALVRGIALLFISFSLSRFLSIPLTFENPKNWRIMMIRSTIVLIQGLYFAGMQFYITQPIVQTLNSTGPLFVYLLDYKINHVKVTKVQFIGIIIGIIGVLLTVNGQIIMLSLDDSYETQTTFENYQTNNPYVQLLVGVVYIVIQLFWAWAMILTKETVGMNGVQINFHLGVLIMFSTGILYPIYVPQRIDVYKIFWAFLYGGLPIALAGLLFNAALTMSNKTGALTISIFLSVIIGYFVSIFRYDQNINPICSIGSILIIYGLTQTILRKSNKTEQLTNSKSTAQNLSSPLIK